MLLRFIPITTLFTLGALMLSTCLWLASPQEAVASSFTLAEMLSRSLSIAALSGLIVDGLRFLAQAIWPTKKKPQLALRDVLNANLS